MVNDNFVTSILYKNLLCLVAQHKVKYVYYQVSKQGMHNHFTLLFRIEKYILYDLSISSLFNLFLTVIFCIFTFNVSTWFQRLHGPTSISISKGSCTVQLWHDFTLSSLRLLCDYWRSLNKLKLDVIYLYFCTMICCLVLTCYIGDP